MARIPGPTTFRLHKPGLSLMLTASNRRRRSLKRKDTECSSRTRKNRGVRLLVVSFRRKDCWLGLLLLRRCERENSAACLQELMEAGQRKQPPELAILNLGFPQSAENPLRPVVRLTEMGRQGAVVLYVVPARAA